MTSLNLTIDALWHCLCPSFSASLLSKSPLRPRSNATRTRLTPVKCARSRWSPAHDKARNQARIWHQRNAWAREPKEHSNDHEPQPASETTALQFKDNRIAPDVASTKHLWARGKLNLTNESTPALYELLRTSANNSRTDEVEVLVDRLVRVRHRPPDSRIYSALILSNVHHADGSVPRVNALLHEMVKEGVHLDIGICHDVLKVLAVHPDYILREGILHYMQQRWYNLSVW